MMPWKMFARSVAAVTLLTAGGFAAGQELPFSHASRGVSPSVEVDETPTEEEAPDVDPAAQVDEEPTTTTTAPEVEAPDSETPDAPAPETAVPDTAAPDVEVTVDDSEPIDPQIVDVPANRKAKPAPAADRGPKAKKDCHVTHPWKGDHNNDGHCDQGWHNKDAAWLADRADRPEATDVAAGDAAKGDHNNDGHADNGHKNGGRPETAPGQVKKAERHGEGRR
jgi:hypothetical protein